MDFQFLIKLHEDEKTNKQIKNKLFFLYSTKIETDFETITYFKLCIKKSKWEFCVETRPGGQNWINTSSNNFIRYP